MTQITDSKMIEKFCDHQLPSCPVCMETLGTYGGPSSLPCGHNGCLHCLQQLQAHKFDPVCPLCRTPFDAELNLGPNLDLKDILEKLQSSSSLFVGAARGANYYKGDAYKHKDDQQSYYDQVSSLSSRSLKTDGSIHVGCVVPTSGIVEADNKSFTIFGDSTPVVNAQNLARGALAIFSRILRPSAGSQDSQYGGRSLNNQDLGMDTWSDVHGPTAPPLESCSREDAMVLRSILDSEPPQWVPDSACTECMQCNARFQALTRGRHHCRFCGGIFCRACSKGKCLLPMKFREREPQRVCDTCYEKLEPLQDFLIQCVSNAAQIAIHDVTDLTCIRGWVNNPLGTSMEEEIYKATNILRMYSKIGRLKPEQSIPEAILQGAKGLAILTVAKVGMMLTYKLGTGLIIACREDGNWSPPVAIATCGLGWGLQVGGELIDLIIVLRSQSAVKTFSKAHLSIGAGLSISAGPLGRLAEADLHVGNGGAATSYSYSCCQGAFVGVSFEGNVMRARMDTNAQFYGDVYLSPEDILFGLITLPRAAAPLYSALHDLFVSRGLL